MERASGRVGGYGILRLTNGSASFDIVAYIRYVASQFYPSLFGKKLIFSGIFFGVFSACRERRGGVRGG